MEDSPVVKGKRDRDSEGETPKPEGKLNKMAATSSPDSNGTGDILSSKFDSLLSAISDIKKNQESMNV